MWFRGEVYLFPLKILAKNADLKSLLVLEGLIGGVRSDDTILAQVAARKSQ
jgi:hypothetical protein